MQIVVRPDEGEVDWAELHQLLSDAFSYMDGRIDPPSSMVRMSQTDLREKARRETLMLAQTDGALVGCLFAREEGAWLYVGKIGVKPGLHGVGIGRKLMDQAFKMARRLGMAELELQSRIELTENHRWFERRGFVTVGTTSHKGFDRPTTITMRAALNE